MDGKDERSGRLAMASGTVEMAKMKLVADVHGLQVVVLLAGAPTCGLAQRQFSPDTTQPPWPPDEVPPIHQRRGPIWNSQGSLPPGAGGGQSLN